MRVSVCVGLSLMQVDARSLSTATRGFERRQDHRSGAIRDELEAFVIDKQTADTKHRNMACRVATVVLCILLIILAGLVFELIVLNT